MAGTDLGMDNIAAIVSMDHSPMAYKGDAVLSENSPFIKKSEAAKLSPAGRGTDTLKAQLRRLSLRHNCFMHDAMHKISADIVRCCIKYGIGTTVFGANRCWKQWFT